MSSPDNPSNLPERTAESFPTELASQSVPCSESVVPAQVNTGLVERFPVWGFLDLAYVLAVLLGAMLASQLVALMVASIVPAFKGLKLQQLATSPVVVLTSMAAGYLLTLLFVYRLLAKHYRVGFLEGMHWRWPSSRWPVFLFAGVFLSLVVQGASAFLPIPKDLPIDAYFRSASGAWAMALFGTFIAPFVEEVLFRGLLFPVLARSLGTALGVVLTGGVFALVHAGQLGRAWSPVLMLLVVGIALTLIRHWTRSLASSVLVHSAYNATIFGIVILQTHGFQQLDKIH